MPVQPTLVDPPSPRGISVTHPVQEQDPDLGEQGESAFIAALGQRTGLPREEQRLSRGDSQ
jgi:hypothetical protein